MKKLILSAAVCAALAPGAYAQTAATPETAAPPAAPETAAAPASPHTFTGNVAVVSDYRFRGISQTFKRPAIQGGFDYSHSSGFYVGNWNSSVSGVQYNNGAGLEMDLYGGYKHELMKDLTADIGVLYYLYPGAKVGNTGERYTNGEIYVGATYKWFSAKLNYGITDFFGLNSTTAAVPNGNSKGSAYLDLAANYEILEKTTLNLHVGHQWVRHYGAFNYTDYKVGIARDFGFATLGLAVIGTDADRALYTAVDGTGRSRKLSDTTAVLSLSKTF
jgi:uncharacterized protein (TIGR02001 family)